MSRRVEARGSDARWPTLPGSRWVIPINTLFSVLDGRARLRCKVAGVFACGSRVVLASSVAGPLRAGAESAVDRVEKLSWRSSRHLGGQVEFCSLARGRAHDCACHLRFDWPRAPRCLLADSLRLQRLRNLAVSAGPRISALCARLLMVVPARVAVTLEQSGVGR
eukprot:6195106-Pleurochrysis_carterae.AAC.3